MMCSLNELSGVDEHFDELINRMEKEIPTHIDKEMYKEVILPDYNSTVLMLNEVFREEYGDEVISSVEKGIAISNGNKESVDGILMKTTACKYLGVYACIIRIGKNLNIKFYTLIMPIGTGINDEKQHAMSVLNNLSPTVVGWEKCLKETCLLAIQKLLNEDNQKQFGGEYQEINNSAF